MSRARWEYWDVLALCAGAAPLLLAIAVGLFAPHHNAALIFVGSAGELARLASLICVGIFAIGAVAAWRSGSRWLIGGGGLLLLLSASPSFLLLLACFSDNCY